MSSVRLFNPFSFDTKHGGGLLQEIIHYGESRFRAAIVKILVAEQPKKIWGRKILYAELVSQAEKM